MLPMRQSQRRSHERGFTLTEIMVASLIGTSLAGGTMMAFVTAMRLNRQQGNPSFIEAELLAQETLERHRNDVWEGSPFLFDVNGVPQATPWTAEALTPPNTTSESIENMNGVAARRCYRVVPEDCDGVGGTGDCFMVQVQVCWSAIDPTCNCP